MAGSAGGRGDGSSRADDGTNGDGGTDGQRGGTGDGSDAATVERAMTAVSVAFTLALVGVVVWQAMTAPADVEPRVRVVGTETGPDGRVEVTVRLRNAGSVGLASATVELDCTSPPPELTFQHVPASGRRRGTVVCPVGTTAPNASLASWEAA